MTDENGKKFINTTIFAIVPVDIQPLIDDGMSKNLIEQDHRNIRRWFFTPEPQIFPSAKIIPG